MSVLIANRGGSRVRIVRTLRSGPDQCGLLRSVAPRCTCCSPTRRTGKGRGSRARLPRHCARHRGSRSRRAPTDPSHDSSCPGTPIRAGRGRRGADVHRRACVRDREPGNKLAARRSRRGGAARARIGRTGRGRGAGRGRRRQARLSAHAQGGGGRRRSRACASCAAKSTARRVRTHARRVERRRSATTRCTSSASSRRPGIRAQILADTHGNVVFWAVPRLLDPTPALKVVEETPS